MSPFEAWYRRWLTALTRSYLNAVSDPREPEMWRRFERDAGGALKASDLLVAARLRRRARLRVSYGAEVTMSDALRRNQWYREHAKITHPRLEDAAAMIRQGEEEFYRRAATRPTPLGPMVPRHRVLMFMRNSVGEAKATAEQVMLADPEVGDAFPFAEYQTQEDRRVRPTHALMQGLIAVRWWPGWATARPPAGYNCRCWISQRTWDDAERRGWLDKKGNPKFIVRWPNQAARANFQNGLFPDKDFRQPRYVAPAAMPERESA